MSGTREGYFKSREKMIKETFGSEAAFKAHLRNIGAKGGAASTTGGFASNNIGPDGLTGRQRARVVGALGGRSARRKEAEAKENTN